MIKSLTQSFEDGASSPLSRYRIRNMQLVEGVSYAGQDEYPVYGDLGNKFGSERLFVVKHNIKVTSNPDSGKPDIRHPAAVVKASLESQIK